MCNCDKNALKKREFELLILLAKSMEGQIAIVEDTLNNSRYCKPLDTVLETDNILIIISNG